ncbi:MAG: hypothetical protein ACRD2I_16625, partial [Vicinamibacterales bacterium]
AVPGGFWCGRAGTPGTAGATGTAFAAGTARAAITAHARIDIAVRRRVAHAVERQLAPVRRPDAR